MPAINQRFDLQDRVVVITGGGKGIGKVYAQEFARAGARVVAADIDGEAAKAVAAAIAAGAARRSGLRPTFPIRPRSTRSRARRSSASAPSTC